MENNEEIPSDAELEDIFLSDGGKPQKKIKRQIKDPKSSKKDNSLDHLVKKRNRKVKKLERANKPEVKKKPQGRPRIWTEEKIAKQKSEKAAEALQKREFNKELEKLTKLSLNQGFGEAERHRVAKKAIKNKEEISAEFEGKKQQRRELAEVKMYSNDCNHLDKISYIHPKSGLVHSSCIKCSRTKEWEPHEWRLYFSQVKQET